MDVYELTREAYRALVLDGITWMDEGDVNGSHTAYELFDLGEGDWLLVEMVTSFGFAGAPVVVRRYADQETALVQAERWESDALKLARYYGCKMVRSFEVWHILPDDDQSIRESLRQLRLAASLDSASHSIGSVRTVDGTYEPVYSYTGYVAVVLRQVSNDDWLVIGETRFESIGEFSAFLYDDGSDEYVNGSRKNAMRKVYEECSR